MKICIKKTRLSLLGFTINLESCLALTISRNTKVLLRSCHALDPWRNCSVLVRLFNNKCWSVPLVILFPQSIKTEFIRVIQNMWIRDILQNISDFYCGKMLKMTSWVLKRFKQDYRMEYFTGGFRGGGGSFNDENFRNMYDL